VAVFIYRKPFTHLFSAVGYGVIGSRDRADVHLARAGSTAARNTVEAATVAVPGFAGYRAARWARRNPAQAAGIAAQVATAGAAGTAGALAGAAAAAPAASGAAAETDAGEAGPNAPDSAGSPGAGTAAKGRARGGVNGAPGRTPPPLDLPSRTEEPAERPPSGWARTGTNGPLVPSQSRTGSPGTPGQPSSGAGRPRSSAPGPAGWHPGNGQSAASRTPPAIPVRAPSRAAPASPAPSSRVPSSPAPSSRAPASPPPSSQSRAAPPARRPAPPAAPRATPAAHATPAAFPGASSARSGNGARADEPAGPAPFWLRPLRRRK